MERESHVVGARQDDQLKREVASLTHGTPLESRAEDDRLMEGAGDDEPSPEGVFTPFDDSADDGQLRYADIRARSDLARHLRPSIFPADRASVLRCATELNAAESLLDELRSLPDGVFVNVEAVWEALGGAHESRGPAAANERSVRGAEPASYLDGDPETLVSAASDVADPVMPLPLNAQDAPS